MKILIVTAAFAPVVAAHSERAVALARLFKALGHEVVVANLDGAFHSSAPEYDAASFVDSQVIVRSGIHGILKARRSLKFVRLGLDVITFAPGAYIHEAHRMYDALAKNRAAQSCDLVWVTTPPHELQLVGYRLSLDTGMKYVMDLRDPWGDSTRIRWTTRGQRRRAQQWYERCLHRADAVVANTPQHYDLLAAGYGKYLGSKVYCLPNGYFEADFMAAQGASLIRAQAPVLTYAGGLYAGAVEEALSSLDHSARRRGLRLRINVVGAASGKYPFNYRGAMSPAGVIRELVASDALFLLMPRGAQSGPVMSLKAYPYARSGKPILYAGPKNETYEYLVARSRVIDCADPDVAIEELARVLARSAQGGAECCSEEDSWEARVPRLEAILAGALSKPVVA